jgi:hypothetical protein
MTKLTTCRPCDADGDAGDGGGGGAPARARSWQVEANDVTRPAKWNANASKPLRGQQTVAPPPGTCRMYARRSATAATAVHGDGRCWQTDRRLTISSPVLFVRYNVYKTREDEETKRGWSNLATPGGRLPAAKRPKFNAIKRIAIVRIPLGDPKSILRHGICRFALFRFDGRMRRRPPRRRRCVMQRRLSSETLLSEVTQISMIASGGFILAPYTTAVNILRASLIISEHPLLNRR